MGYSPCVCKESDMTEQLTLTFIHLERLNMLMCMKCIHPEWSENHSVMSDSVTPWTVSARLHILTLI